MMTCTMIQRHMPGSRRFALPYSRLMLSLHYVACMQTGVLNNLIDLYQTSISFKNLWQVAAP